MPASSPTVKPAILRMRGTPAFVGLSRAEIYRRIKKGKFPKPISLGGKRAVGFLFEDVERWVSERVAESRKEAA